MNLNYISGYFLTAYTDSSYITKQKASLLLWSHIILLPVLILYLLVNISRNNPREWAGIIIIDLIMIAGVLIVLYLLKKGRFNTAVIIDITIMMLITIAGHYIKRYIYIETGFNNFSVYIFGLMVFTSLFSSRLMQTIVSVIFFIMTLYFYFYYLPAADPSVHIYLLSGTLNIIIVIFFIFVLLYYNRIITDKALQMAQDELDINTELNRSLEQKVNERTIKLAEERESLNCKNMELEEIKSALIRKNNELETAKRNAEEANMAKSRFLATLSHELRTPLNGIIGISSLMMEKKLSDEDISTLQMIKQSGENLFFIIQDLLDFTTIENNQISIKNSFFSIDELLEHITFGLKDQIENKNLKLTAKVTPEKSIIFNDRTRIAQIITNLVSNSVKYTNSGSIDINISIENDIVLKVSDTGIGIDEKEIDTIFEAFTRIDNQYVKSQTGLGLGLSIISQIINIMNGSISVESSPGEGSVFTVKLPVIKSEETACYNSSSATNFNDIMSGKKILIVEDNAVNRFYFDAILKKAGAVIDIASNGREGLDLANTVKYDIILMDLNIPDFDGLTLTKIIRSTVNPNSKTIITALSAHGYKDHIDSCIKAGMNDFISKPVEREQFLDTLCTLLQQKQNQ